MSNFVSQLPPNMIFQDNNPMSKNIRKQLIKNIIKTTECEITVLEDLFFSADNIDLINKQLMLAVWKKSDKKYRIGFQEINKLIVVMRYVFIEYAKHLPYNIKGQIEELNCIVVGEIVPNVITNFEQKLGYLRDIETRTILPYAVSTTSGKNLLPSTPL